MTKNEFDKSVEFLNVLSTRLEELRPQVLKNSDEENNLERDLLEAEYSASTSLFCTMKLRLGLMSKSVEESTEETIEEQSATTD